jgi:hypothetical protein
VSASPDTEIEEASSAREAPPNEAAGSTETGSHVREIPGEAGHGPARAYGYIALAQAFGASASLTSGGTRSTGAHPLQVTVTADAATFERINSTYDEIAPVAERVAAEKRAEIRKEQPVGGSYELALLTRAVLAGFPLGAASAFREPGTTKPSPLREATRARKVNNEVYRAAVASGRAWARRSLTPPAQQQQQDA